MKHANCLREFCHSSDVFSENVRLSGASLKKNTVTKLHGHLHT